MIICLVTDRRRADPIAQARAAAAAAIDLVHVRERDLEARDLAALVRRMLDAVRGSATRVLVNDRLDVAMACGADGVQLRADSFTADEVRRMVPAGFLVARSVHTADEAAAASDVDFLVAGTVFPSSSKPGNPRHLEADGLRRVVDASHAPVLAIGGVSLERIPAVARAGAAGIAAIGLFQAPPFESLAREMRLRFDSGKAAS